MRVVRDHFRDKLRVLKLAASYSEGNRLGQTSHVDRPINQFFACPFNTNARNSDVVDFNRSQYPLHAKSNTVPLESLPPNVMVDIQSGLENTVPLSSPTPPSINTRNSSVLVSNSNILP